MDFTWPERLSLIILSFLLLAGSLLLHFRDSRPAETVTIEKGVFKEKMTLEEADIVMRERLRINVNAASIDQLVSIPGIGPGLASEISAYRASGGTFLCTEDLLRIHGIGPKKLEKIRGYVKFE